MYMQGQYEIDHVVTNYTAEAFRMAGTNVVNLVFSLLNILESVLDVVDELGRLSFYRQEKRKR